MKDQLIKKLQEEISTLDRELKLELPKEIRRARELGDLRENAEYHAAKERQSFVQARISMLQQRVATVSLINLDKLPQGKAAFGSTVHLRESTGAERRLSARHAGRRGRREGHDFDVLADRPRHRRQRKRAMRSSSSRRRVGASSS